MDLPGVLALYDHAIGNGQPEELLDAADQLAEMLVNESLTAADSAQVSALMLHLRGVASLSIGDDDGLESSLAQAQALRQGSDHSAAQGVLAVLTFCSYYPRQDLARLDQALRLFGELSVPTNIARLDAAISINEIRTHSLALAHNLPGYSADRVEVLTNQLRAAPLAPRLATILTSTLADFYGRLAAVYGDARFLRQGLALLEPVVLAEADGPTADAALGGVWQLLALGLEFDRDFPIPREMIAQAQCRVRRHRSSGEAPDQNVCRIAYGLGLRARFDWERSRKQTGVLRALAYLRLAARMPLHETVYATTLRVAYEAGLGEGYLHRSLERFEAMRARPGFRPSAHDEANFASTLMLIGNAEKDAARLAQAISLYEGAIAREPDSAVNVSRHINLASAILSYVQLPASGREDDASAMRRLERGLDSIIWMEVLDRPGSTHAPIHGSIASSYYAMFEGYLHDDVHALILNRTLALFAGKEQRWPIGFVRYLVERVLAACDHGEPDCDLLLQCAHALERAKLFLQVIDLCDGGDVLTAEIDGLFAAAIAILRQFIAHGRDSEGLRIVDRLTAGFVRHVTAESGNVVDPRVAEIVQRAIAGQPVSPEDVALIRRSTLGQLIGIETGHVATQLDGDLRLDLLRVRNQILAIRRDSNGFAARLFGAEDGALPGRASGLVSGLADFALESSGPLWIGFRNIAAADSHDLFNALRARIEIQEAERPVLRHGARSLAESVAVPRWTDFGERPRFLIVHSPRNHAPPLNFGFAFAAWVRESGADVVELTLDECRREAIARCLADADIVILISHGERGTPDRILLAGDDYADAGWLLDLGRVVQGKCLFFVACNSGHFNARLTHDDIGLAPLALASGARGVFSTLRSVDELSILLLVTSALDRCRQGSPLSLAFEQARLAMLRFDEEDWSREIRSFLRRQESNNQIVGQLLDATESPRLAADRADIDIGWSFIVG